MPDIMRNKYARAVAERVHARSERARWVTLDQAIEDGEKLLADLEPVHQPRLSEHLTRLRAWREEAGQLLGGSGVG